MNFWEKNIGETHFETWNHDRKWKADFTLSPGGAPCSCKARSSSFCFWARTRCTCQLPSLSHTLTSAFLDSCFRLCCRRAEAGAGQGDRSVGLLPAQRLRRLPDPADDLCWHNGRRGGLLPGYTPTVTSVTQLYYNMYIFCNRFNLATVSSKWFVGVLRGTAGDPWCVRQPVGSGGWRGWWAGERAAVGRTNQASTVE